MLAYRARYVTGILTYTLFVSVNYFIWQAVFASSSAGGLIHGMTLSEMITYITVGWIARSFYYSNIDDDINDLVSSGQVSTFLIRPVDFQAMLFAGAFGEALFRFLFFAVPVGITIVLLFPVSPPPTVTAFLLFCASTILGLLIFAAINFSIGLTAFSLKSIRGLLRAKYFVVQLFSGLLLPLQFFPGWFGLVVKFLPFQAIAYLPLQLYLGKVVGRDAAFIFAEQFAWLILCVLIGRFFWSRSASRLTIQGG